MASGIPASSACNEAFMELKLGKKHKYIIYKIGDDKKEIVVEDTSNDTDYDTFLNALPENQCRWAVYDFEFEKEGAGKRNKICFISWSPDEAKIKDKMVFASSKDALRKSLVGIQIEIQATSLDEVSHETVLEKANRGS